MRSYLTPGDQLVLKCGGKVTVVGQLPEDQDAWVCGDDIGGGFKVIELAEVSLINGKPRTPSDKVRLEFLVPLLTVQTINMSPSLLRRHSAMGWAGRLGLQGVEAVDHAIRVTGYEF